MYAYIACLCGRGRALELAFQPFFCEIYDFDVLFLSVVDVLSSSVVELLFFLLLSRICLLVGVGGEYI